MIYSAAILSHNKTLLARHFVSMTKTRSESLLSAFPKLIGEHAHSQDHTFVETESVRYLYVPIFDHLFVVVITNKSSNILEDLSTVNLISRVIQDLSQNSRIGKHKKSDEDVIKQHAFDIIFHLDEMISSLGYREDLSTAQLKVFSQMESHNEDLQEMLQEAKIQEAREAGRKKQAELQKARIEEAKKNAKSTSDLMRSKLTNMLQSNRSSVPAVSTPVSPVPEQLYEMERPMPTPVSVQHTAAVPRKKMVLGRSREPNLMDEQD